MTAEFTSSDHVLSLTGALYQPNIVAALLIKSCHAGVRRYPVKKPGPAGQHIHLQKRLQILPGIGFSHLTNIFRCAAGDNIPAFITAFGADVDDVIGCLDDF